MNQDSMHININSPMGNNFQEHLDHLISENKSRFRVVFDQLRLNQYSIVWSEVIDKKGFV